MKKTIFLFAFISLMMSCNNCKDVACFTPPEFFHFQFVDRETGEDLLANGTFLFEDIKVTDMEDGSIVPFSKIIGDDIQMIELNDIGWKTEKVTYKIEAQSIFSFKFYVDAEAVSEKCCSFTRIHEVKIMEIDYSENTPGDIFQILI